MFIKLKFQRCCRHCITCKLKQAFCPNYLKSIKSIIGNQLHLGSFGCYRQDIIFISFDSTYIFSCLPLPIYHPKGESSCSSLMQQSLHLTNHFRLRMSSYFASTSRECSYYFLVLLCTTTHQSQMLNLSYTF